MPGVYIHLPFCRVRCTYCPFAISTDISAQSAYLRALLREIESRADGSVAETIYLGGGTPSRTEPQHLRRLGSAIRERFRVVPGAEFSIEANPEDIDATVLAEWSEMGVTRLSIGVQSFEDAELLPLGRVHGAAAAIEAVDLAVRSGLRVSLDLILGLPGQTEESFRRTLRRAIESGAGHVSLYMLDLEEGTALHRHVASGRTVLPDDDQVASLYLEAVDRFREAGLDQYEISNFARDGEQCRHNLGYWRRGEYFGFGLGAHSFLRGSRFANTRQLDRYIERSPDAVDFQETLGSPETRRETIFLGLRQTAGMKLEDLARLCGQEGKTWVDRGLRGGWLREEGGNVAFTPAGFLLSNEYISQLF
jgi:oxygen-independent coproporphyrinogen-3 oxidase